MRALYFIVSFILIGTLAAYVTSLYMSTGDLAQEQHSNSTEFASGPQVGSKVPGPFEVFNINGKDAGHEACLYCRYDESRVAMIFASKPSHELTTLVKHLEKAAPLEENETELGACVILTQQNDENKTALTQIADTEKPRLVVLGTTDSRYLKKYKLHSDAELTVILYSNHVVRVNRAFKSGEFTEKSAADLGDEAAKFLAAK